MAPATPGAAAQRLVQLIGMTPRRLSGYRADDGAAAISGTVYTCELHGLCLGDDCMASLWVFRIG